jgi:transposase-like protein
LIALAALDLKMGTDEHVEALAQRALRIHEEHLGALHPYVANDLTILASLSREQGNYTDAEPLFLRALQITGQTLAPTHPQTAEALHEFALLRQEQGRDEEARALFQRALAARAHTLGAAHPLTLGTRAHLDVLSGVSVRAEEAEPSKGSGMPASRSLAQEAASANASDVVHEHNTTSASEAERMRAMCPQCHQTVGVLKSGKNRAGSQRFRCRTCHLYFTPEPIPRHHDQVRQAAAMALANQGMSNRSIARQLGVHHQTVSAWIGMRETPGAV